MPLRILFFGTPRFAVPTLEALLGSAHAVVGVVTQPDRRRGRGQRVTPEAIKRAALEHGLPIFQPDRLKDETFIAALEAGRPDVGVVAAYGRLIPDRLLSLPRLGMINVHASLLPRWRGAAPVQRAILAGDSRTGVTIMRVVRQLDAGPIMASVATPIQLSETSAELEFRLAALGAGLLRETLDRMADGTATEEAQDGSLVTHAARLDRRDSEIDWARPARAVHDHIRGLHPWPYAATLFDGRRLILRRSEVSRDDDTGRPPGTVVSATGTLDVATRPGAIRIVELQTPGRAPVPVAAFLRGHRIATGAHFGPSSVAPP
jgi:methionyl-tRNA formyltransferase